ncbi:MAG UNVERIFIED_CONTAM: hypothetical protein LVR29_30100 [Microcystis novacekii LVE1205-3]|jgi:hypothetical protein
MKKLYPIITATSLVFIASLAGYHLPAIAIDLVKKIPVFIPDDTKVSLKNGTSLSGRLIKFDSPSKNDRFRERIKNKRSGDERDQTDRVSREDYYQKRNACYSWGRGIKQSKPE